MARHSGKNGKVKAGANTIAHVTNWSIDESVNIADLTSADDTWATNDAGKKSWSGSMTFRLDHDAGSNQDLRAGDVVTLELYSEGDASGKTYYSGSAIIAQHGVASPYDNAAERTYSFTGTGALSIATVTP